MPPIDHGKKRGRPTLDDILNGMDEFGLLDVEAKAISSNAPIEVTKFESINAFIDEHGRSPSDKGDLSEKLLARRLKSYLNSKEAQTGLKDYDRHGLFVVLEKETEELLERTDSPALESSAEIAREDRMVQEAEEVTSLADIFASEGFADIDFGDQSLFEPNHVQFSSNKEVPDEIAQRRTCEDFYQFENIFRNIHDGLKSGDITTSRFSQVASIEEGDSFVLQGVVCLVDSIGEYRTNTDGRYDPRLRVIFENGTESNLLMRSLTKRLYEDENGRRIAKDADSVVDSFNQISHKDQRVGQIYFVSTKSDNPNLLAIPNLVKIGYTELTVEDRTKNAVRDTAFLEAPVKILASIECFNMNPNKLETLIHGFLHAQRLKMTLKGKDGKSYHPKEWFSVPLDTALDVVRKIIDGEITKYRMDNTTGKLIKKK